MNNVIVLGAGATKACGGPLTHEILPAALNGAIDQDTGPRVADREELLYLSGQFLHDCFHVPLERPVAPEDCPALPRVLSMLRRSIDLGQPIGSWEGEKLVKARRAVEYGIFAVIEATLRKRVIPLHSRLLTPLCKRGEAPAVISLNYDVIVDNAMFGTNEKVLHDLIPPDYGVDIATELYRQFRDNGTFGQLLKIHGSMNWLYCETCERLELLITDGMRTSKALNDLYHHVPFGEAYSCRGTPCRAAGCPGSVSPILITPTYFKDYGNRHVARVWERAEEVMKAAERAVLIGYSLPDDDVEVGLLLKRGLGHLPSDRITVLEHVDGDADRAPADRTPLQQSEVGRRYKNLFGPQLDWHTAGFAVWLDEQERDKKFPFRVRAG